MIVNPFYLIQFIFGILVGSFLNVCITRLPRHESIVFPSSHCDSCMNKIAPYDNIPIVSFLLLRGRCRHCGVRFSWQYPLIELLTGVLSVLALLRMPHLVFANLWLITFVFPLLVIAVIDLKTFLIPDSISIPGMCLGFLVPLATNHFQNPWHLLFSSFLGWMVGGGVVWGVAFLYEKFRREEGLGFGDVKLMAMIGAFLGAKSVMLVLFLGSLLGLIVGLFLILFYRYHSKSALPFGPFLVLAALIVWLVQFDRFFLSINF